MKHLTIFVDEESRLPCQIDFETLSITPEDLPANGRKSQTGLWILAAQTALMRGIGAKRGNTLLYTPEDCDSYIAALFTPLSREKMQNSHWLFKLFGENPKSRFLIAQQNGGRKLVSFTDDIEVCVFWWDSGKKCNTQELTQLRVLWNAKGYFLPRELFPIITCITNFGSQTIERDSEDGYVCRMSKVSLTIESNHQTNLCVFWIDSEQSLFCLHPFPDELLQVPTSLPIRIGSGLKLTIPEGQYLTITTRPGIETCLILTSTYPFNSVLVEEIRKALLITGFCERPPQNSVRYKSTKLSTETSKPTSSSSRLGPPSEISDWEQAVATGLGSLAETVQFFHIPNKV